MRPVQQEAVHSLWSRLFCGPLKMRSMWQVLFRETLKMRSVPEKAVFDTEYHFRTVEACFLHRMLLKMRRVPEKAVSGTEYSFRTVGACFFTPNASENASRTRGGYFWYRIFLPYRRRLFPVPNFSN